MRRPLDVAKGDIVGSGLGEHANRERHFQQLFRLVPANLRLKINARKIGIEHDPLHDFRGVLSLNGDRFQVAFRIEDNLPGISPFKLTTGLDHDPDGAFLDDFNAVRIRQFELVVFVFRNDVPGRERPRNILEELKAVALGAFRQHLALVELVVDGCQVSVCTDAEAEESVLHDLGCHRHFVVLNVRRSALLQCVGCVAHGRQINGGEDDLVRVAVCALFRIGGFAAVGRDEFEVFTDPFDGCTHVSSADPWQRVEDDQRVRLRFDLFGNVLQRTRANLFAQSLGLLKFLGCPDKRLLRMGAGQSVVELVQQHQAPAFRESFTIISMTQLSGKYAEHLGIAIEKFAFPVELFDQGGGGKGSSMPFHIELVVPFRKRSLFVGVLFPLAVEPRFGRFKLAARQTGEVFHPANIFKKLAGHAASAVPEPPHRHRFAVRLFLVVFPPMVVNNFRLHSPVEMTRREMHQKAAAVQPLPPEGVVRELVGVVPCGQLDRGGEFQARLTQNLRKRPSDAEHVRKPANGGIESEFFPEVAFAVQNLPHIRLARRQVAIRLHVEPAGGFPTALFLSLLDFAEELRKVVFQIFVEFGLRLQERKLGVFVHQAQGAGCGAGIFADSFFVGPEIDQIQMRLSDNLDVPDGLITRVIKQVRLQIGPGGDHLVSEHLKILLIEIEHLGRLERPVEHEIL